MTIHTITKNILEKKRFILYKKWIVSYEIMTGLKRDNGELIKIFSKIKKICNQAID